MSPSEGLSAAPAGPQVVSCRTSQADAGVFDQQALDDNADAPRAFHFFVGIRRLRRAVFRTAEGVAVAIQPALPLGGVGSPPPNSVMVAILYQIDPDLSMTMYLISHFTAAAKMRFQGAERGYENSGSGFLSDAATIPALLDGPRFERALPADNMPNA